MRYKICIWQITHIISHFTLAYIFNITTFLKLISIIIFNIIWHYSAMFIYNIKKNYFPTNDISLISADPNTYVYKNVYKPRVDDQIYNGLGLLAYNVLININYI